MEPYQDPSAEPFDRLDAALIDHTEDTRDQAQAMETMTEETGPHPENSEIEEVEKLSDSGSLADDDHVSQDPTGNEDVSQNPATVNDTADEGSTLQRPITESAMVLLKKTAARLDTMIERLHTMEAHGHVVDDRLGTLDAYVLKTEKFLQTVNKCIKVVEATTDEYFQRGNNHFEFINASIQKTYDYLQTMDNHLEAVDGSLYTAIGRLDNADEHFETIENSLQTVRDSHQVATDGLGTIDGRLNNIDEELRTVNENFRAIEKSLQILSERLDTIDEKNLHSIVEILNTMNEDIEVGYGRLDKMQNNLHDIDGHLKIMNDERIHDSSHMKSMQEQLDEIVNVTDEQLTNSADIKGMQKDLEQAVKCMDKQQLQNHIQVVEQLKVLDERTNTAEDIHAKSDGQTTERLITIDKKIDSLGQEIQDKAFSNDERMKLVTRDIVNLEKRVEATGMATVIDRLNEIDSSLAKFTDTIKSVLSDEASTYQQFVEQQAIVGNKLTTLGEAFGLLSTHTKATNERQNLTTESIKDLNEGVCDRLTIISNNVLRLRNDVEDAGQSATTSVETLNAELKKISERDLQLKNDFKVLVKATVSSINELKEEVVVEKKEHSKNHTDVSKRLEALEKVITDIQGKIGDIDQRTLAVAASSVQVNKHESTQTQSIVQDLTDLGERIIADVTAVVGLLEQALQEQACKYECLDKTILATKKMIEATKEHAADLAGLSKRVPKDGALQAEGLKDDIKTNLNALEAAITSIRSTAIEVYGSSPFRSQPLKEAQQQISKQTIQTRKDFKELTATRFRNLAVKIGQNSNMSTINSFLEMSTRLLSVPEKLRALDQEAKHLLSAVTTAELSSEKTQTQLNSLAKLLLRQLDELSTVVANAQAQVASTDTELSTTIPGAKVINDIIKKTEANLATTQDIYNSLVLSKKTFYNVAVRTADVSRSTTRTKIELKQPKRTLTELNTEIVQRDGHNGRNVINATQTSQSLTRPKGGVRGNAADSDRSNQSVKVILLRILWVTAVLVGLLAILIYVGVNHEGKFVMHNGNLVIRI